MNASSPDDIRLAGWAVAIHNDYRLRGKLHTFWLFTVGAEIPGSGDGRYVMGEGTTDARALNVVRDKLGLPRMTLSEVLRIADREVSRMTKRRRNHDNQN